MLPNKEFFEGVALKKCVLATYNNTTFKLAPHVLYTRHEEVYVDAIALEKNGEPPREMKIGTFKLTGLKDVKVVEEPFERNDVFDPKDEKYLGETLMMAHD